MKKYLGLLQGSRLILVGTAFACLALLGLTAWSSGIPPKQGQERSFEETLNQRRESVMAKGLKLENKTKGLTIVSIEKKPQNIEVLLRNDYSKTITAYRVSVGKGVIGTELFASENESNFLHPGEERQELYPYQAGIEIEGITILAVIFEDRITDGDPEYVREIEEQRLGRKMQRQYALQLLERIIKLPPAKMPTALASLESEASALQEEEIRKLPVNVEVGLRAEKGVFLRKIQNLHRMQAESVQIAGDQEPADIYLRFQNEITSLAEKYKRTIAKL